MLEKNNFIIEYDDKIKYIPELIGYLETKMKDIIIFFKLNSLKNKIKIVIYDNLEEYKRYLEKYTVYHDYLCADTYDGNINVLSLKEAHKTKSHKNITFDIFKRNIVHEFVHICQHECQIENYNQAIVWFWEALATNLGNPENNKKVVINSTNEEIYDFDNLENNYFIAYTIGKYMLKTYTNDKIIEYVRYPSKLLNDSDVILNNARQWSKK